MTAPPSISAPFDRALKRLQRARRVGAFAQAAFLKQRAIADVLDRLEIIKRPLDRVLDLGSHGGWLRQALAARPELAGRVGQLIATDTVPGFLAGAGGHALAMDEERFCLADGSFNAIVSTLALHWVNDLPGTFVQARRALAPDGVFIAVLLGGRTLHEWRACLLEAEIEVRGGAGPRVSPFADAQDLGGLLQRAGFALPVTDTDQILVRYREPMGLLRDLQAMGESAALQARATQGLTRRVLLEAFARYQARYADADGRVRATFELVTATGWAPHASQQKPLAPGSARMRLADALGVSETSTGEKPH